MQPGQVRRSRYKLHLDSDNAAPRVPTRVAHQAGSSIWPLSSRPSAFTSTSCPPSGSTFRPDQVASTIAQAASETRGNEPQGCPLLARRRLSVLVRVCVWVMLSRSMDKGVLRIRDIFVPSNHHIGQAFESWPGSSPLARFPPPAGSGSGFWCAHLRPPTPSPKQPCSTSPQKGSAVKPQELGAGEGEGAAQ